MDAVVRATVSAMPPSAPTPDSVVLSGHAVLQYQQRVKPGLEPGAARAELDRLRSLGQISADAPHWLNAAKPAPYYLLLGDAIVLPLAPHGRWVDRDHLRHPAHADPDTAERQVSSQGVATRRQAGAAPNPVLRCRSRRTPPAHTPRST